MKKLSWEEYVAHFDEWAESTRNSYVSRLESFGSHQDVAWITSNIYNEVAASKLINMAIDAGVRFDKEDIYLLEFSVNAETLKRMKDTADEREFRKREKKAKKNAFWTGVAHEEFAVDFMNDLFGKKRQMLSAGIVQLFVTCAKGCKKCI